MLSCSLRLSFKHGGEFDIGRCLFFLSAGLTWVWCESLMSSAAPLVPRHITISASPQSNNLLLDCNKGRLGEMEVILPITGGYNNT